MTDLLGPLQAEVRETQRVLVALLQERLETETRLRVARAELKDVTRGIEQLRADETRQVVEFDRVVQGARAESRSIAAEIEELIRRRAALIQSQPKIVLSAADAPLPLGPLLSRRSESLPTDPPDVAPPAHHAAGPADAMLAARPVVPGPSGVPQRAPRLAIAPIAGSTKWLAKLRSLRAQLPMRAKRLQAARSTAGLSRVRLRRPGLRQTANVFIGCLLALLAILLTPVSQIAGGLQLLAVMSGSMEPTIHVGGIVGVRPVAVTDLQVGNVITFATQANPDVLVTHRIVSLETRDGQTMVTTKGDANDSVDAMAAPADHAVGRVDFSLPWLGFLMVWLASPVAKILILVVTVIGFALPSVKRSPEHAAAGGDNHVGEPPATSYTALEDEIQALLNSPTQP